MGSLHFVQCFLPEGLFGYSRQSAFIFLKVPGRPFFPNLSKFIIFAAAPFVRNSGFSYVFSREKAEDWPFPDKSFGEDYDFFIKLKRHLVEVVEAIFVECFFFGFGFWVLGEDGIVRHQAAFKNAIKAEEALSDGPPLRRARPLPPHAAQVQHVLNTTIVVAKQHIQTMNIHK